MSPSFFDQSPYLGALQGQVASARIPLLAYLTVAEWQRDHAACLARVRSLGDGLLIVRSGCQREDGANKSNAGAFLSLPNISREENLEDGIDRVIASYGEVQPGDEVLVQPMLRNVIRSGVAFSHDPHTGAPYRVVNWSEGGDTTLVTSGRGGRIWQQAAAPCRRSRLRQRGRSCSRDGGSGLGAI